MTKRDYRTRLLEKRRTVGKDTHEALARAVAAKVAELAPASVGLFWPIRGEPDFREVLRAWQKSSGGTLCLPETRADGMVYRTWEEGAGMLKDTAGIPSPDGAEAEPELLIAPCVGYSLSCRRLGYGGGYFDRYLASASKRPTVIGAAFDEMTADDSLFEPFDEPLDFIVTERRILTRTDK